MADNLDSDNITSSTPVASSETSEVDTATEGSREQPVNEANSDVEATIPEAREDDPVPFGSMSRVSELEEELANLRVGFTDAVAQSQKQASEISDLIARLKETETESSETLVSLRAALGSAETIVATLNSAEDDVKRVQANVNAIPAQLTLLNDEIVALHEAATTEAEAAKVISEEISLVQAQVNTTLGRVNLHEQAALTAASAAATHQSGAAVAANSVDDHLTSSSKVLEEVQSHFSQVEVLEKKVSAVLETAQAELTETEAANVSAKEFIAAIKADRAFVDSAKKEASEFAREASGEAQRTTEAGERVAVLEKEINTAHSQLAARRVEYDDMVKKIGKEHSDMVAQINSLLPGATSAGLASAFRSQKESYDIPKIGYIVLFVVGAGFLAFGQHLITDDPWITGIQNPWELLLAHFLQKSPVELPFLFLVYFAFRAFTTADKLQQDYAYKERIASTFEGFKAQFASVESPPDKEPPLSELCRKLLTIIGQHPARFYDPKHIEDLPSAPQAAKQLQAIFERSQTNSIANAETTSEALPVADKPAVPATKAVL